VITRARPTAAALAIAASLAGCYSGTAGNAGAGDTDDGGTTGTNTASDTSDDADTTGADTGVPASCDADARPRASLVRLSRDNYVHALGEVFGDDALAPVLATIDTLPEVSSGAFATEVPPAGFAEVSAYFNIASQLAFDLTKDEASLAELSACLPDVAPGAGADDPCVAEVIDRYGTRLLRRPLDDEDRTRFVGDYAVGAEHSVAEGIATALMGMLLDPRFLYFVETDGEEIEPGIVALTDHELAARLARVLWDSIPDDELLAAADLGLDDATLLAQVERMLADGRSRPAISRFASDWLTLDVLPQPPAALFPEAETREAVRVAMQDELARFVERVTLDEDGTYADLLLDRGASIDSPELAALYGVEVGDDIELPDNRAGLLTRAGWLATQEVIRSNAGHIIKRGRRLGDFLCRPVPAPDPGNFPTEDPADPSTNPDAGIRERFAEAASEPQCATCHQVLDAFGGPLGHYGAAGEWIDVERIDVDGQWVEVEIDVAGTPMLDEAVEVDGAIELSAAIASSNVGPECLATQLTRNALARPVDDGDECLDQTVRAALAPADGEPESIRAAIVALVTSAHFREVALP
jgi:hypothetical protein